MKHTPPPSTASSAEVLFTQPLTLGQFPVAPADRKEVLDAASRTTRRIAETNRAEAVAGLRQVQSRAAQHGAELGDLGPSPEQCGAVADELDQLYQIKVRLDGLQAYVDARRALCEQTADRLLRDAHDEVTRRIERGRIPAESYAAVRAYHDAHGAAVSQGLARAARVRSAVQSAPAANDTTALAKTGTDPR